MFNPIYAAYLFTILIIIVALFQLALALGAPWGEMAMGGKFPGQFPPPMRVAAVVQMLVLIFLALIVLTAAGLILPQFAALADMAIWGVVLFCLVSAVMNTITPSKKERMLWAPVTYLLLASSLVVALV
jgi:hypothetical protein